MVDSRWSCFDIDPWTRFIPEWIAAFRSEAGPRTTSFTSMSIMVQLQENGHALLVGSSSLSSGVRTTCEYIEPSTHNRSSLKNAAICPKMKDGWVRSSSTFPGQSSNNRRGNTLSHGLSLDVSIINEIMIKDVILWCEIPWASLCACGQWGPLPYFNGTTPCLDSTDLSFKI